MNRFALMFACFAVGMIVVSGLLLVRNRILVNKLAEVTLQEREASKETSRVQSEFLTEKEHASELEHHVAQSASQEELRGEQIVQLLPGLPRGEGSITSVSILGGTQIIELDLRVVTRTHAEYRVRLYGSDNNEIAMRAGAKALNKSAGTFVPFSFPANEIPAGDYKILLEATGEQQEVIPIGDYHFRIEHNR
jgi:hypothetical protein